MSDSSATSKKSVRTCSTCRCRMSNPDLDSHVICIACRGKSCSLTIRCDHCIDWTDDKMNLYLKHQASLERKRKSKQKAKVQSATDANLGTGAGSHDTGGSLSDGVVLGEVFDDSASSVAGSASRYNVDEVVANRINSFSSSFRESINADLDDKLESFGTNIVQLINAKFIELARKRSDIIQDVPNNPSFPAPHQAPGQLLNERPSPPDSDPHRGSNSQEVTRDGPVPDVTLDSPPSLSPQATQSLASLESLRAAGILSDAAFEEAKVKLFRSVRVENVAPSRPLAQVPPPRTVTIGGSSGDRSPHPSDVDVDSQTADFRELINFVISLFPDAKADPERPPPPSFIRGAPSALSEVASSPRLVLFDRLHRVREDVVDKVKGFSKDLKKPSSVFPRRRHSYRLSSAEQNTFAPPLNDAFVRIAKSRPPTNASVGVSLEEFRRLELAVAGLQEAQSFSFWLVSALVEYFKQSGFHAPDEALYSRLISSLSVSFVDQAKASFSLSAFLNLTRREHFLKFSAPSVTEGQKKRLLSCKPFGPDLFDPEVLSSVIQEFEGAAATSSHIDLSKAVARGLFSGGKRKREDSPSPSTSSPLVPHGAGSSSSSRSEVASLFDSSSKSSAGKGKGFRRGGKGAQRGRGGSSSSSKSQGKDFAK